MSGWQDEDEGQRGSDYGFAADTHWNGIEDTDRIDYHDGTEYDGGSANFGGFTGFGDTEEEDAGLDYFKQIGIPSDRIDMYHNTWQYLRNCGFDAPFKIVAMGPGDGDAKTSSENATHVFEFPEADLIEPEPDDEELLRIYSWTKGGTTKKPPKSRRRKPGSKESPRSSLFVLPVRGSDFAEGEELGNFLSWIERRRQQSKILRDRPYEAFLAVVEQSSAVVILKVQNEFDKEDQGMTHKSDEQ